VGNLTSEQSMHRWGCRADTTRAKGFTERTGGKVLRTRVPKPTTDFEGGKNFHLERGKIRTQKVHGGNWTRRKDRGGNHVFETREESVQGGEEKKRNESRTRLPKHRKPVPGGRS